MELAPIVLFVYKRPEHTKKTLDALKNNELAKDSILYVFSDGAKNSNDLEKVQEVRELLKTINGFKEVIVIEREKNWGLADNIIDGVTTIINKYGKIIVLEDDHVTSPYFLTFMNKALEKYKDEKRIWHISGWNYPIKKIGNEDAFFWRVMNCWGWGTWADRWHYYNRDILSIEKQFTKEMKKRFNLDGVENFWRQIELNKSGAKKTWAIFWYATIFLYNGLCLNPVESYVENIGLDGSGENCPKDEALKNSLNLNKNIVFPEKIIESEMYVDLVKDYLSKKKSLLKKIKDFFYEYKFR